MPMYDFGCLRCSKEFEEFSPVDRKDFVHCICGGETKTFITVSSTPQCLEGYDPDLGVHITGPAQKRREMKKLNLEEISLIDSRNMSQFISKPKRKTLSDCAKRLYGGSIGDKKLYLIVVAFYYNVIMP